LIVAAGVAWAVTDGWVRIGYLVGAALAAVAAIVVRIVRARGRLMTTDVDNGVEVAHLDVAAEIAVERDRMTAELMRDLDGRTDVAELVRRRSAAIGELHSRGGAMEADEPDTGEPAPAPVSVSDRRGLSTASLLAKPFARFVF
ncbi:MAG: hypothetical protein K0S70_3659, partial [Microbacterium sp.]|nr:hypothetical protein [Microbacterium sp.]